MAKQLPGKAEKACGKHRASTHSDLKLLDLRAYVAYRSG